MLFLVEHFLIWCSGSPGPGMQHTCLELKTMEKLANKSEHLPF